MLDLLVCGQPLIPIPITRQTDGQRWKKSHNEVSKIVEV